MGMGMGTKEGGACIYDVQLFILLCVYVCVCVCASLLFVSSKSGFLADEEVVFLS